MTHMLHETPQVATKATSSVIRIHAADMSASSVVISPTPDHRSKPHGRSHHQRRCTSARGLGGASGEQRTKAREYERALVVHPVDRLVHRAVLATQGLARAPDRDKGGRGSAHQVGANRDGDEKV